MLVIRAPHRSPAAPPPRRTPLRSGRDGSLAFARAAALATLLVATLAVRAGAQPAPPSPSPAPQLAPPAAPANPAGPAPSSSAAPASGQAEPLPSPTPNPFHYIVVPPQAAAVPSASGPQIVEVALSERTLDAPGPVLVRITTTPNVGAVTARVFGRQVGIPQIAPGIFGSADQLPALPAFLLGRTYDIEIIASTPDGRSTSFTLPIALR